MDQRLTDFEKTQAEWAAFATSRTESGQNLLMITYSSVRTLLPVAIAIAFVCERNHVNETRTIKVIRPEGSNQ
ncbi:MAG TPA: hypothetical protein VFF31_25950 [Blastocatellia bacterium]|nr:hypothetical protein [Blastocatellia bacterium]